MKTLQFSFAQSLNFMQIELYNIYCVYICLYIFFSYCYVHEFIHFITQIWNAFILNAIYYSVI